MFNVFGVQIQKNKSHEENKSSSSFLPLETTDVFYPSKVVSHSVLSREQHPEAEEEVPLFSFGVWIFAFFAAYSIFTIPLSFFIRKIEIMLEKKTNEGDGSSPNRPSRISHRASRSLAMIAQFFARSKGKTEWDSPGGGGVDEVTNQKENWGGNRLVYPHRTGFRPVISDWFQTSVMSDAQSMSQCHVGCTVSFRKMHSHLDRNSGKQSESGLMLVRKRSVDVWPVRFLLRKPPPWGT